MAYEPSAGRYCGETATMSIDLAVNTVIAAISTLSDEQRHSVTELIPEVPGRVECPAIDPVEMLFVCAGELTPIERRRLGNQLIEDAAYAEWTPDDDVLSHTRRARDYVNSLRTAAERLGHTPNTTEYRAEYDRLKGTAEAIRSVTAILRFFGSWEIALDAAALRAKPAASSWTQRIRYGAKRVYRYPGAELVDAIRRCGEELGRPPTIRDYSAWRHDQLGGVANRRVRHDTIPHFRTIENHFGGWRSAVAAAGLNR